MTLFFSVGAVYFIGYLTIMMSNVIIARQLSVYSYGYFSYMVTIVLLLQIIIGVGMPQALMRYLPRYSLFRNSQNNIKIKAALLVLGQFTVLVLVSNIMYRFGMLGFLGFNNSYILNFVLISALGASIAASVASAFQSIGRYTLGTFIGVALIPLFLFGTFIIMVSLNIVQDYMYIQWYALVHLLIGVTLLIYIFHFARPSSPMVNEEKLNLWDFQSFGLKAMVVSLVYLGLTYVDRLMLGIISDYSEVGIYNVAARMSRMIYFSLFIFTPIVGPIYSKYMNSEYKQPAIYIFKLCSGLILIYAVLIALIFFLYGHDLIIFLFGAEYLNGTNVLYILTVGALVTASAGNLGILLQMGGRESNVLMISMISLLLNVVLNIIMIPKYGAVGASISTSSSYIVLTFMQILECWKSWHLVPYLIGNAILIVATVTFIILSIVLKHATSLNWYILLSISSIAFILITAPWSQIKLMAVYIENIKRHDETADLRDILK